MHTLPASNSLLPLWKKPLFRAALLIAATLLAYLPATHCGYIWDDDVYVTENPLLSAPDGLRRIWFTTDSPSQYFPLVYTTFRFEYAIWKLNPAGYHWVNILLHIANALLVWRLLARLEIPGSWLAAMIFALHPVHVESVAWITERKNVLSVFFFLLTLLAWTEFIAEDARKKWRYYALALLCCALALCSKTTACTLPAAMLLILWLKHQPIGWRRVLEIVPFLALGAGMGMLTIWWERYHQGTQGKLFALGLADRILIASHAVWFYLGKLFLPVNLTFSYPHWTLHPGNPLAYGWLLACLALWYVIYCAREDIDRAGEVAALYFVATLSPMLGFIMLYTFLYSFVADHYQYAASIGPIALVSAGIVTLAKSWPKIRNAIYGGATVILLMLALLTWNQCGIYHNSETVWFDTMEKNPGSLMAHFNLANELVRDGHIEEARSHRDRAAEYFEEALKRYNRAVEIDPAFVDARINRADFLVALGRMADAGPDYSEAARLYPNNITVQNSLLNYRKHLADSLVSAGDFADALPNYQEIERHFPDNPHSHLELGAVWLRLGKPDEAIREYNEAIRLDPRAAEASTGLASAYAAEGRFVDAVAACLTALEFAERAGDKPQAASIRKQIQLYQKAQVPGLSPNSSRE